MEESLTTEICIEGSPYQVMPPLSAEEYEALKADIKQNGVLVPVDIDEQGRVLDGHHRIRIARELGIKTIPFIVRLYESEQDKLAHAIRVNVKRRHLSKEWRRSQAEALRRDVWSYEAIASALGISVSTAYEWTKHVFDSENVDMPQDRTDSDGVRQPLQKSKARRPVSVFAGASPETAASVAEAVQESGEELSSGFVTRETVKKRAKKKKRAKAEKAAVEQMEQEAPAPSDRFDLICGDLADVLPTLDAESVDVIITDPPYGQDALGLYETLAREAARILKPGRCLYVMTGQSYLPEILERMATHITYRWTIAYLTQGAESAQLWDRSVNTFWKPILCFSNGPYTGEWMGDVVQSKANDKRFHQWGQSESGMAQVVEKYSTPGDLIVDPFCGSGTTGLAALMLDRRFCGIDVNEEQIAIARGRLGKVG